MWSLTLLPVFGFSTNLFILFFNKTARLFLQLMRPSFVNLNLGDFEVFINYSTVIFLAVIIYNVINCFSFKNLIQRFGLFKNSRKDFYECGFKPQKQKPIQLPIQFLLICIFFLLYDIELVFLFPYVSGVLYAGLYDFLLLFLFFFLFLISLIIDYERHALYWQY